MFLLVEYKYLKEILILGWLCFGFVLQFEKRNSEKEVRSILQLELVVTSNRLVATSVAGACGEHEYSEKESFKSTKNLNCIFTCLASVNGVVLALQGSWLGEQWTSEWT